MIIDTISKSKNHTASILIIGLGNPILGDDGIGWSIAQEIESQLTSSIKHTSQHKTMKNIKVIKLSLGGLRLMESMVGFDSVILIDAISTGKSPLGSVIVFPLDNLPNNSVGHLSSPHDTSLQNALLIGKSLGAKLPKEITVVGIESKITYDFSEEISMPIKASIPEATSKVMELIS
jgi:hydrogenase maturation protease